MENKLGKFLKHIRLNNSGYITIESSIIVPFLILIFVSILFFAILYHDVLINRLDAQDKIMVEYFSSSQGKKPYRILFSSNISFSFEERYFSKKIISASQGKKSLIFHDFKMNANFYESINKHNKKAIIRSLDVVDSLYGVFSDSDVRNKIDEIESKIK